MRHGVLSENVNEKMIKFEAAISLGWPPGPRSSARLVRRRNIDKGYLRGYRICKTRAHIRCVGRRIREYSAAASSTFPEAVLQPSALLLRVCQDETTSRRIGVLYTVLFVRSCRCVVVGNAFFLSFSSPNVEEKRPDGSKVDRGPRFNKRRDQRFASGTSCKRRETRGQRCGLR